MRVHGSPENPGLVRLFTQPRDTWHRLKTVQPALCEGPGDNGHPNFRCPGTCRPASHTRGWPASQEESAPRILHLFICLEKLQPIFCRRIQQHWDIPIFLGELGLNGQVTHFVLKFHKVLENVIPYSLLNMSFAIYI